MTPVPADAPASSPGRPALSGVLLCPLALATLAWTGVLAARFAGPVDFPALRPDVLAFLAAAYAAFAGASVLAFRAGLEFVPTGRAEVSGLPPGVRQLVVLFALVGAAGAAARGVDIVFLRGLDFSAGLGAARLQNMALVEAGGAGTRLLAAVGKAVMGASTIAMLAVFLRWEQSPRWLRLLVPGGWALMLGLSVFEGGRNTIVINVVFAVAAGIVRLRTGKSFLPLAGVWRRLVPASLLVLGYFAVYVFIDRFEALGYTDDTVILAIESAYSVEVGQWVRELPAGGTKSTVLGVMMVVIYLGHGVDQLAPLLDWLAVNPLGHGGYNLDLVVLALGRIGLPLERYPFSDLPQPGLYYTGLGELAIDLGVTGTLLLAYCAGLLGAGLWRGVRDRPRLSAELVLCGLLAWILASPLYSILSGFLGVFLAAALFAAAMRLGLRYPAR